jgi:predicted NAD/FAD-binding protein
VTLFEAESSCGGHTLTDSTGQWPVDLGFQVSYKQVLVLAVLVGAS